LDCDTEGNNAGCDGGWMYNAYEYLQTNGIMLDSDYPYIGEQAASCSYDAGLVHFTNTG